MAASRQLFNMSAFCLLLECTHSNWPGDRWAPSTVIMTRSARATFPRFPNHGEDCRDQKSLWWKEKQSYQFPWDHLDTSVNTIQLNRSRMVQSAGRTVKSANTNQDKPEAEMLQPAEPKVRSREHLVSLSSRSCSKVQREITVMARPARHEAVYRLPHSRTIQSHEATVGRNPLSL